MRSRVWGVAGLVGIGVTVVVAAIMVLTPVRAETMTGSVGCGSVLAPHDPAQFVEMESNPCRHARGDRGLVTGITVVVGLVVLGIGPSMVGLALKTREQAFARPAARA